jgi:integrase/recombinase XerD
MNSKQGARYIKRRMGNDLKEQILVHNGIIAESEIRRKLSVLSCPRCSLVNAIDNKYCSKCSYPLVPSAFDEIKATEDIKFKAMEERFNTSMDSSTYLGCTSCSDTIWNYSLPSKKHIESQLENR